MPPPARPKTTEQWPEEWIEGMDYRAYIERQTETMGRVDRDENLLWRSMLSHRYAINTMDLDGILTAASLPRELHEMWFECYVAGRYISADSPAQDRLVIRLIQTQRVGAAKWNPAAATVGEVVHTADGVLWTDLPFFAKDMLKLWKVSCPTMAADERVNLSSFPAKVASVGLCDDKLFEIALVVLRDMFELPRSFSKAEKDQQAGSEKTMADLTVTDLLPSACAWLDGAGARMGQLADVGWHDCAEEIATGGSLYYEDKSAGPPLLGLSAARWIFWFRRLSVIESEPYVADRVDLRDQIARAKRFMVRHALETHSGVRRAFEPPVLASLG